MVFDVTIFCNPILDFLLEVDEQWMTQFALQPGGYVMYDTAVHRDIYKIVRQMAPLTIPGGAGQNTARLLAHLYKEKSDAVAFFGCVGGRDGRIDDFAQTMYDALRKAGVHPFYQLTNSDKPTGSCAVCIHKTTRERSMCTNIGASSDFSFDFALQHWHAVDKARIIYFTGFFVTASPQTIGLLCEKISTRPRQLLISCLSAPFIIENFTEQLLMWLSHSQIVVGNEEEMRLVGAVVGDRFGLKKDASTAEIMKAICASPDYHGSPEKPRILIATRGGEATLTASRMKSSETVRVDSFSVRHIPKDLIVDKNGCGDGFCSGLIYQLAQVHSFAAMTLSDLAQAIEVAHYCGGEVLQHMGCQYSQEFFERRQRDLD